MSDLKGNNHQDQKLYFYFSSPGKDQIIYKESLTVIIIKFISNIIIPHIIVQLYQTKPHHIRF